MITEKAYKNRDNDCLCFYTRKNYNSSFVSFADSETFSTSLAWAVPHNGSGQNLLSHDVHFQKPQYMSRAILRNGTNKMRVIHGFLSRSLSLLIYVSIFTYIKTIYHIIKSPAKIISRIPDCSQAESIIK